MNNSFFFSLRKLNDKNQTYRTTIIYPEQWIWKDLVNWKWTSSIDIRIVIGARGANAGISLASWFERVAINCHDLDRVCVCMTNVTLKLITHWLVNSETLATVTVQVRIHRRVHHTSRTPAASARKSGWRWIDVRVASIRYTESWSKRIIKINLLLSSCGLESIPVPSILYTFPSTTGFRIFFLRVLLRGGRISRNCTKIVKILRNFFSFFFVWVGAKIKAACTWGWSYVALLKM